MLVSYFIKKGFSESFERRLNPIMVQDLPLAVLGMDSKMEVEPHALSIDPTTSRAVLGWNLFVLGNQRMFLGETHHENLLELARQIRTGQILPEAASMTRRETTPKRLIAFVTRVLGKHDAGYVDLTPTTRPMATQPANFRPMRGPAQEAQLYSRSGYGT